MGKKARNKCSSNAGKNYLICNFPDMFLICSWYGKRADGADHFTQRHSNNVIVWLRENTLNVYMSIQYREVWNKKSNVIAITCALRKRKRYVSDCPHKKHWWFLLFYSCLERPIESSECQVGADMADWLGSKPPDQEWCSSVTPAWQRMGIYTHSLFSSCSFSVVWVYLAMKSIIMFENGRY